MATTAESTEGKIADAVYAAYMSPAVQTRLLQAVTKGEADLPTLAQNLVSKLKNPGGLEGTVFGLIENEMVTELTSTFKNTPPQTIVTFINGIVGDGVKAVGG